MEKHNLKYIAVAFVDGSGRAVTKEELKELSW